MREQERNKARKGQILSAAAAPGAEGRQGRSAMNVLLSHSELVIVLFYFRYELKWAWTMNRVPWETLIQIKEIIFFAIEIKILRMCSAIWE